MGCLFNWCSFSYKGHAGTEQGAHGIVVIWHHIIQMHRFGPTRRQHRLNLGSTLANKPNPGPLGPKLGPTCWNLAPSWTRLGGTSAQVEVHMLSKWRTWPAQCETLTVFQFCGLSVFTADGCSSAAMFPTLGLSWAELWHQMAPAQDQVMLSPSCVQTCPSCAMLDPSWAQVGSWSQLARVRRKLGPSWAQVGSCSAQLKAKDGQVWPQVALVWPSRPASFLSVLFPGCGVKLLIGN